MPHPRPREFHGIVETVPDRRLAVRTVLGLVAAKLIDDGIEDVESYLRELHEMKDRRMELVEFEPETSYEIERVFAEFASVMAGDRGFEPRLTDPESAVLPLDESPAPRRSVTADRRPVIRRGACRTRDRTARCRDARRAP